MNFINQLHSYIQFIYTEPEANPITNFTFENELWVLDHKFEESTLNQWMSYELIEKQHKDNPLAGLPLILSVLCRKEGEKFNADIILERAEIFKNLPCDIALSLRSFFLTRQKLSATVTQLSLQLNQIEQQITTEIWSKSQKNTHTSTWRIKLQALIMKKLLNFWMRKSAISSRI